MSNRELLERCRNLLALVYFQVPLESSDQIDALHLEIADELSKPSLISKDQIRETLLSNGFTVKEGQDDLKPYVYEAVYALLDIISKPSQSEETIVLACDGPITVQSIDDFKAIEQLKSKLAEAEKDAVELLNELIDVVSNHIYEDSTVLSTETKDKLIAKAISNNTKELG